MMRIHGLLAPLALTGISPAVAQVTPSPPNVQTAEVLPAAPNQTFSPDPRGITTADTGSSIDKPATAGAMPQTGYHDPVIGKQADPPPHQTPRTADQGVARPDPPARAPNVRRAKRRN